MKKPTLDQCVKKIKMKLLAISVCVVVLVDRWSHVEAHGYLKKPAHRGYMGEAHPGSGVEKNGNKMALNCGGTQTIIKNEGKCGVCGDNPDNAVRPHENGKFYVKNAIAETYNEGQRIDVEVDITAHHKGWFEFRLCVLRNVDDMVTQDCLNKHLLTVVGGTTLYNITEIKQSLYTLQLQLPAGVSCDHCVIQWWWMTANSWGCNGKICGTGKGYQELFVNCADVTIVSNDPDQAGDANNQFHWNEPSDQNKNTNYRNPWDDPSDQNPNTNYRNPWDDPKVQNQPATTNNGNPSGGSSGQNQPDNTNSPIDEDEEEYGGQDGFYVLGNDYDGRFCECFVDMATPTTTTTPPPPVCTGKRPRFNRLCKNSCNRNPTRCPRKCICT